MDVMRQSVEVITQSWLGATIVCLGFMLVTYLSRMECPTVINWTSPFLFLGLSDGIFHFYSNFKRTF